VQVAALLLARSMATHTITAAEPARKGQSDHKVMMSLRYLDSHCIITAQEWFKPAVVTKLRYHLHGTRETSVQSRVMAALPASLAPVWGRLLSSVSSCCMIVRGARFQSHIQPNCCDHLHREFQTLHRFFCKRTLCSPLTSFSPFFQRRQY
jgi:hypothetical protein